MASLIQCSCSTLVLAAMGLVTPFAWAAGEDTRPDSQQEYWAQFDRRDWNAAVAAAQDLVTAARQTAAQEPLALADTLSLLGNAQLGNADYVSAEATFSEALQLVEQHAGTTSSDLLDPLQGLGYTLAAAGRHSEAVPHLDRALLITHRSHGLFDIGQQGLLRQLATSLTKTERAAEAERHINYLLRVGEQSYGGSDPRLVPLLCDVGDWYADTGNFVTARDSYRYALDIVEEKLGKADLAAIEPLRALARSYTQELLYSTLGLKTQRERYRSDVDGTSNEHKTINPRFINSDGERALAHALKILETQPAPPARVLTETLIQMGDWFQIKHQPDKALRYYRRVASVSAGAGAARADEAEAQKDSRPLPLSFPVRVYYPTPVLATRKLTLPPDQTDEKFVQVEFTVTGEGAVTDARVTDQNGTSRQASETLEAIRAARFRPKFIGGEPVETTGMTNREVFKTRKQSDEEKDS